MFNVRKNQKKQFQKLMKNPLGYTFLFSGFQWNLLFSKYVKYDWIMWLSNSSIVFSGTSTSTLTKTKQNTKFHKIAPKT